MGQRDCVAVEIMIALRFVCGHLNRFEDSLSGSPHCQQCGESRIQSVQAPAPRFTGFCSGPSATTKDVPPHAAPLKGN